MLMLTVLGIVPLYVLLGVIVAVLEVLFSARRPPPWESIFTVILWPYVVYKFLI